MKKILLLTALCLSFISGYSQIKKLDYKGTPVFVLEKTPDDFPIYFQNKSICEDNLNESNPKARCVKLNSNGTGTFQNDYFNSKDLPATPIKWFVVCNDKGETLAFKSEDRLQYRIIIEYTQIYYSNKPGDLYSMPCTLLTTPDGTVTRVLIDSKFYNL
jgi:hypothetical protein